MNNRLVMAKSKDIIIQFNEFINKGDLAGLAGLMTDDHTFIDTEGNSVTGKENCIKSWRGFFKAFPDYKNIFTEFKINGSKVIIKGHSTCSEKMLESPALWKAIVEDDKVKLWQVFEDNLTNRDELNVV